ncbi:MAG: hypothetical protein BWY63_02850 [Chloroflexi bacterium ADurb.Bin360]|nr:MAG: hypothetical protein BWY63_02850 [Chloroflexi bacterium ADurb.Bin360]
MVGESFKFAFAARPHLEAVDNRASRDSVDLLELMDGALDHSRADAGESRDQQHTAALELRGENRGIIHHRHRRRIKENHLGFAPKPSDHRLHRQGG